MPDMQDWKMQERKKREKQTMESRIFQPAADGFAKGKGTMASAHSADLNGGLGRSPQRGSGQSFRYRVRERSPLKLKALCIF